MFYILLSALAIIGVGLVGAIILSLLDDETSKSILYDDPEYFDGELPKWMREEDEE